MAADRSRNPFVAAAKIGDRAGIRRLCRLALACGDVTGTAAALKSAWQELGMLPFDRPRALVVSSARPDLLADAMRIGFAAADYLVETAMVANFDMVAARAAGRSDIVVVCTHAEDVLRASRDATTPEDGVRLAREAGGFVAETVQMVAHGSIVLCCEITPFSDAAGVPFDPVAIANAELAQRLPANAILLMNAEFAELVGDWLDPRLHALAGTPYTQSVLAYIAYRAAAAATAMAGRMIKLVITDLDGTLWPGVIAEDGIPAALETETGSSAHRSLRRALAALPGRGIILAAASHNDLADTTEALALLQDGTLTPQSFAAIEAGWEPKPVLIGRLLERLNLDAAATMIIDDDPVRCAGIHTAFPEADVRHMDGSADAFAAELERDPLLSAPPFPTGSAMDRTRLYEIRARAEAVRPASGSLEEFCRALDMRIAVAAVDDSLLPRAFELTRRTNQFNATGWRPALEEMRAAIGDPARIDFLLHLGDRFGDHGWVGLVLAAMDGRDCRIEGFYLSCRALGRTIETAMLAELAQRATAKGATYLAGEIATLPRNEPARDLYRRHDFEHVAPYELPAYFRLALSAEPLAMPPLLKVER
ncbi:MAG TPA: HAD-IIIC family phosphatase [Rhizomicrobium sp.]|nr:HAD-IIIC family phosphatase [Rhizomicrobium sp.]